MTGGVGPESRAWSDCRNQKISKHFLFLFFFLIHGKLQIVLRKQSVQSKILSDLYINIDIANQSVIELQTKQKFYKMVCPVQF